MRACVAGWRAGGVCAGGGTGGAAGPCHAGRPRGRTRGRRSRRGAGGQGGLVTRPASQTEVCPQPAMGGQITRNTLHGKAPANAWGPPGRLGQKGTGTDGLVIPCPLTPWWAPGLCVCGTFGWSVLGWGKQGLGRAGRSGSLVSLGHVLVLLPGC